MIWVKCFFFSLPCLLEYWLEKILDLNPDSSACKQMCLCREVADPPPSTVIVLCCNACYSTTFKEEPFWGEKRLKGLQEAGWGLKNPQCSHAVVPMDALILSFSQL